MASPTSTPHARPDSYMPRVADAELKLLLNTYGAVEVQGTKWCGKTWTSRAQANSIIHLDEQNTLAAAQADPHSVLAGPQPRVLDEWQLAPHIWDAVRHEVDEAAGSRGMWILTGSSTPRNEKPHHSGAGRFGTIRMFPMSLFESGESDGSVSLSGLFAGEEPRGESHLDSSALAAVCARGGWPAYIANPAGNTSKIAYDYLEATLESSIPQRGATPQLARQIIRSFARNLGAAPTFSTLIKDASTPGEPRLTITERTVGNYIRLLEELYLLEPVPGWDPALRSPMRLRGRSRHYFADPSLALAALGLDEQLLLEDWQTFGLVFENLAIRDVEVYARALPRAAREPVRYYRDDSNLEADVIIEQADGTWAAIEIKLSHDKVDQAATNLLRLHKKTSRNLAARNAQPAFLAVLIGIGSHAYRRADGIYVIPIGCLGP